MIKSNTTDSLRTQREIEQENKPTRYRKYLLKTIRINWEKDDIDQKGLPDNSENLRNTIGPYS